MSCRKLNCLCGNPKLPGKDRCARCEKIERDQRCKSGPYTKVVGVEEIGPGRGVGHHEKDWQANMPDFSPIAGIGESFKQFCLQHNL